MYIKFIFILFLISGIIFWYLIPSKNILPVQIRKGDFKIKEAIKNCDYDKESYDLTSDEKVFIKVCPTYTEKGYKVTSLRADLKKRLLEFWKTKNNFIITEPQIPHRVLWGTKTSGEELTRLLDIKKYDNNLANDLITYIKSLLEEWCGEKDLEITSIYGIREYNRGAVLKMHLDRIDTHVLSVIIHIDKKVNKDWPLVIFDRNRKKKYRIYLDKKTDLVLYESVTLVHGRPYPLEGDYYANLFIHFKPKGWNKYVQKFYKEIGR
jgi:prolyl 4-hydroxylase